MTREELLNCLTGRPCSVCTFKKENGCSKWNCVFEEKTDDICEDCISRVEVLKPYETLKDDDVIAVWLIRKNIEQQKRVQPIRPKGKWEEWKGKVYENVPICFNCKHGYPLIAKNYNFCPHCGADMRGDNNV